MTDASSGRRGATAVWLFGALVAVMALGIGLWARQSWALAVAQAETELEHAAGREALLLALALRDARRIGESVDQQRARGAAPDPAALLREQLQQRFRRDERADLLAADGTPVASAVVTSGRGGAAAEASGGPDAAQWARQLARVDRTGEPVVGWAYRVDGRWWLPVFHRQQDGSAVAVSLPVEDLLMPRDQLVLPAGSRRLLRGPEGIELLAWPLVGMDRDAPAAAAAAAAAPGSAGALPVEDSALVVGRAAVADTQWLVLKDRAGVAEQWRAAVGAQFAALTALLGLLAGGGFVALRRQRALQQAEQRALRQAQRAEALLTQALAASGTAVWQMARNGGALRFEADPSLLLGGRVDAVDRADPAGPPDPAEPAEPAEPTPAQDRRDFAWFAAHIVPADRARVLEAVRAAGAGGGALHEVFSATAQDGSLRHFMLQGALVRGTEPAAPLLAGTLRDTTGLMQAQQALAESARTLQRMCRIARIGDWQVEPASGRVRMSEGAAAHYGSAVAAPDVLWLQTPGSSDAGGQELLRVARERLLREGVGYDLVLPQDLPDGSRRWLRTVAEGHRGADGVLDRIEGALQDVTPLVEAHQALALKDARVRLLAEAVESSRQLIMVTDADEHITWCNEAFTRVSGYTLDEARGRRPGELLQHGGVPAPVRAHMRRCLDAHEGFHGVRVQNFSRAGVPYWVELEVRPIFDAAQRLECYVGVQTDVTRDIEREAALSEHTRRFELATRHAHIGVWEWDLRSGASSWNETMYRHVGRDPAAGLPDAQAIERCLFGDEPAALTAGFDRLRVDPQATEWSAEYALTRPDGTLCWLRSGCLFERDGHGRALRAIGTLLDISDQRAVQAERAARDAADARSHAKTAFLSRMSHELRTPLNAVIGFAQLLDAETRELAPSLGRKVQRIERAGWNLLALIDDVLDLSRIEAGDVAIATVPLALELVVADALELVEPAAAQAGVTLHAELAPLVGRADRKRLGQVLANLLSNAVKYNRPGGRIDVRLEARLEGRDREACIEITDTGLGLSEAQLAQLFEPFNRLGREAGPIPGTGIGLAITQALVQRMGGRLQVASREGAGSSFSVHLQGGELDAAAPASASAAAAPGRAGSDAVVQVLCVEDNEVNAQMLCDVLEYLRPTWRVRVGASADAGEQALREAPADLVFLDLNLPDRNGLQWLREVREAGLLGAAEVVLLTADVTPETRAAAVEAGLRHVMGKPFSLPDFGRLLGSLALPDASAAVSAAPATPATSTGV